MGKSGKKLDTHWQGRLKGQDPLELMTAREKIDATANEGLGPYVHEIRGGKYGCGVKGCTKFFHGAPFVHKHLKLKHPDLVIELTSEVREDLYFQNYMKRMTEGIGEIVMVVKGLIDQTNLVNISLVNKGFQLFLAPVYLGILYLHLLNKVVQMVCRVLQQMGPIDKILVV